MEIGMNLPVMVPGLDRDTFLKWCERIDGGFFASLAAGERISFYNPDMTAALAAASALTSRVKIISDCRPIDNLRNLEAHPSRQKMPCPNRVAQLQQR